MAAGSSSSDPVLKRAIEKYIRNYVAGRFREPKETLTDAEQRVLDGLSRSQRWGINDQAIKVYWQRRYQEDAKLLEKYMTLYLTRFRPPVQPIESPRQKWDEVRKQEEIRVHL